MKRHLLFLLLFPLLGLTQNISFSDEKLKTTLVESNAIDNFIAFDLEGKIVAIDQNQDGEISLEEAENISALLLSKKELTSIEGIEYFVNIVKLDCSGNKLSSVDISKNPRLVELICSSNNLSEINTKNNLALTKIYCSQNPLGSIDVTHLSELMSLRCIGNGIESLDITNNPKLDFLDCSSNLLTELDLSENKLLEDLSCNNNLLESIDLTANSLLETLTLNNNQLSTLDLSNNSKLNSWFCENNALETLFIKNNTTYNYWSGFDGNPTLKHICVDDKEKTYIEAKTVEYEYTDINISSECEYNLSSIDFNTVATSYHFTNPITSQLDIQVGKDVIQSVSIFALDGRLIAEHTMSQINTEGLPSGYYIVRIHTNKGLFSGQFLKL